MLENLQRMLYDFCARRMRQIGSLSCQPCLGGVFPFCHCHIGQTLQQAVDQDTSVGSGAGLCGRQGRISGLIFSCPRWRQRTRWPRLRTDRSHCPRRELRSSSLDRIARTHDRLCPLTDFPPSAPQLVRQSILTEQGGKPRVPAIDMRAFRFARPKRAADEERFFSARHRNIQKSPVLLQFCCRRRGLAIRKGARDLFLLQAGNGHFPTGRAGHLLIERKVPTITRSAGSISEDDDRCL